MKSKGLSGKVLHFFLLEEKMYYFTETCMLTLKKKNKLRSDLTFLTLCHQGIFILVFLFGSLAARQLEKATPNLISTAA